MECYKGSTRIISKGFSGFGRATKKKNVSAAILPILGTRNNVHAFIYFQCRCRVPELERQGVTRNFGRIGAIPGLGVVAHVERQRIAVHYMDL